MQKYMVATFVSLALLLIGAGSAQALSIHTFEWTGFGGYTVLGAVHDDSASPSDAHGLGAGPTLGLETLMVLFLDPSDNILQIHKNVIGGVSSYDHLSFVFDNEIEKILGHVQVGSQIEPDDLFFTGNSSGLLSLRTASGTLLDFGYGLHIYGGDDVPEMLANPEPSTGLLVGLGLGLLAWTGRRR